MAIAHAYSLLGEMAIEEACGGPNKKADPAKWDEVIRFLAPIEARFADQPGLVDRAKIYFARQPDQVTRSIIYLVKAWAHKGNLMRAQFYLDKFRKTKPNDGRIRLMAMDVFDAHVRQIEVLEADKQTSRVKIEKAYQEALDSAGYLYMSGNTAPRWPLVKKIATYTVALRDVERAHQLFVQLLTILKSNPKHDRLVATCILPDLICLLQEEGEWSWIKPLIEKLVANESKGIPEESLLWLTVWHYSGRIHVERTGRVVETHGTNQPLLALNPPFGPIPKMLDRRGSQQSKPSLGSYRIIAQYAYIASNVGAKNVDLDNQAHHVQ